MSKRLKIVGVVILFAQSVLGSVHHTLNFFTSDLSFSQSKGYDVVELKDASFMEEVGKPMLPVKYISLIIPPGNTVSSISFPTLTYDTLSGTYLIYPTQYPIPMDGFTPEYPAPPWMEPDGKINSLLTFGE